LNLWKKGSIEPWVNDDKVGQYAVKSFIAATDALQEGLVDVLSYSSISTTFNQKNLSSGHTDYLNQNWKE
jgi:4-hydroxythreonine-4-phosphate dehydrogenase